MVKNDDVKFSEIMSAMAELYEVNISDVVMGIWFNALSEYSIEEISTAFSDYVSNPDVGKFKPKPADIIKMIGGSTSDQAYIAWTKVDKAVRTIGVYESVVFDDALIHVIITDMGGWIAMGDITEDEWVFKGKEFMQRYRGHAARKNKPEHQPKMIGVSESNNLRYGFDVKGPVLVGNNDKAQLVLSGGSDVKMLVQEN